MDYDIGHLVACGELFAKKRNSVHGWLGLRDREVPVPFELTGNVSPELVGHHLRFRAVDDTPELGKTFPELRGFVGRHVGVVENISIYLPTDDEIEQGAHPALHLEWFSQSGHVRARLEFPVLEIDPPETEGDAEPAADAEPSADAGPAADAAEGGPWTPPDLEWQPGIKELEEWAQGLDGEEDPLADIRLLDDLIENKKPGMRIGSLFDEYGLPSLEEITEGEARKGMKKILAVLARFGVAFHMCENCTWKHAYALISEHLAEEQFYPQLKGTEWVQHYLAEELCAPCRDERGEQAEVDVCERKVKPSPPPAASTGDEKDTILGF